MEKLEQTVKDLLDKNKEMKKNADDALAKMQTSLDKMETKLVKNADIEIKAKSFAERMTLQVNSDAFVAMTKAQDGGRNYSFEMQLNSIHQPTNFTGAVVPLFRESGVNKPPVRPLLLSDVIQWGTIDGNVVSWIERTVKTDAAAMRAEDGKMSEGNLEYEEMNLPVKIASEYMKVTNETLKDVNFIAGEINTELLSDLRLLVDGQLLTGDGLGNNLKGLDEYATAFVAGVFAGTVEAANEADVLRVAISNIFTAGEGRWMPTYILMHPDDVTKMDLLKITDGRYIEVPFYNGETMDVARVPIIQNVGVNQGEYYVGDFTKMKGFIRDGLTIRVFDQNEDDALFNRSTITANMRLVVRIKGHDAGAFIKGDFITDKAAITV